MNKFKKFWSLFLVLSMVFTLVACAPKADDKAKDDKKETKTEVKEEKDTAADKKEDKEDKKDDKKEEKTEAPKEDDKKAADETPAKSGDVIKIGVFEPFTGASASGGELTNEGIVMAHEDMPEVLGMKVELVTVDNKSDQVEASNAAQRLVDKDKVNAVVGSYSSSLSIAGGSVFAEAHIPAVGCSPTNPAVTKGNPYYCRVCFIDPFQGLVMAKFATEKLGAKTAATVKDIAQDYSVGLVKFFDEAFIAKNGEDSILVDASYKTGDQDFTSQLNNIKEANPDVIFCPGNYGECALMIKQARDLGITAPILGGDTWESPDFISIGGDNINNEVYFSSHFSAETPVNEASEKFLAAYEQKYGKQANAFAALGYDAYAIIIDAIKRANSADPEKIRDALFETVDYVGVTGNITLDENGDAVKPAVVNQVKDNGFVYLTTIYPDAQE